VPYLRRQSELEQEKRRGARLQSIEAHAAKVRLELTRQRARLEEAGRQLQVLDGAVEEAEAAARGHLGSSPTSHVPAVSFGARSSEGLAV